MTHHHPAVTEFRVPLAASHQNLGNLLSNTDRRREAESEYLTALAIYRKLAEAEPGKPRWRREIGKSLSNLGNLDIEAGRLATAVDRLRECVAFCTSAWPPTIPRYPTTAMAWPSP